MARVLIVYATDHGNTERMAQSVEAGVNSVEGAEAVVIKAEDVTVDDVTSSDALVVGSPVHMGSPDHRVKAFIDRVCGPLWMKNAISGKVGAVFASGSGFGNAGGGCELTMLAMLSNLAELGLVLVPLPKHTPGYTNAGIQWGPYGRSMDEEMNPVGVSEERLESSRHHGENIAKVTLALGGSVEFAKA